MKKFKSIIFKSSCLVITIFLGTSFNVNATRFRNKMNKPSITSDSSLFPHIVDLESTYSRNFVIDKSDINCIVSRRISNGNIIHVNSYGTELIVDKVIIDELGREYFFYKLGSEKQRFKDFTSNLRSMKIKYEVKNSSEEYILSLFGK